MEGGDAVVTTKEQPDRIRLHVPRLGTEVDYDMQDEAKWDDRLREAVKAAAVAVDCCRPEPR
jgi:hypothetical protein